MKFACTIIDKKYIPFATVLFRSITRFHPDLEFHVLVVDATDQDKFPAIDHNLHFIPPRDVLNTQIARKTFEKYAHTNRDHLRWALKPVFLLHLLSAKDHCIFLDPDVFLVGDASFLFELLTAHDALLAPHWSETDPLKYEDGLFSVMRNGLYSGGFIGANQRTLPALQWWAEVCHYKMDASPQLGVFVDQKYLDLFPLMLTNAGIIRHPGCNLTNINLLTCRRSIENGSLKINKTFEPVFIHFTHDTIYNIDMGNDPLLAAHLEEYRQRLREEGHDMKAPEKKFYEPLKRKLKLRTRMKRFFFRLAEKL